MNLVFGLLSLTGFETLSGVVFPVILIFGFLRISKSRGNNRWLLVYSLLGNKKVGYATRLPVGSVSHYAKPTRSGCLNGGGIHTIVNY